MKYNHYHLLISIVFYTSVHGSKESLRDFQSMLNIDQDTTKPTDWKTIVESTVSDTPRTPKRQTYISWDGYFVGIALLSALRSKDPHRQVGACIVNTAKRIVGIGYNGLPRGCSDDVLPWNNDNDEWLHTKFPYVVPAETNAVLNTCGETHGSTMYVTRFPCKCLATPLPSPSSSLLSSTPCRCYMH